MGNSTRHIVEAHYWRDDPSFDLTKYVLARPALEVVLVNDDGSVHRTYCPAHLVRYDPDCDDCGEPDCSETRCREHYWQIYSRRYAARWKGLATEMRLRWLEAERELERAHDEIERLIVETDELGEDLAAERRRSEECEL